MRDLVYIYNKVTFARIELGEIQTNFNMSFVIDGTKDSTKIVVHSFSGIEVEPYTILKHQNTNTWWVVSHDKVTRYKNENSYYYTHELELLGAIELLNARDLTDSGFNQNNYTIFTFFERLLKLSNFEFNEIYDEIGYPNKIGYEFTSNNLIDIDKVVDYVKTYENYTLLSALREFFNDYNCVLKLNFREKNDGSLLVANFILYSRTGNTYRQIINDNIFNEVQEIKTIDKKSFGTTVISNAQNVISTKSKTYPSSGLVKPTGTSFVFNGRNGTMVVRLPSQAYKVNYVDMATKTTFALVDSEGNEYKTSFNPFNDNSIQTAFNTIRDKANEKGILSAFDTDINISMLRQIGFRRFYYEDNYNPNAKQFVSDNYIPIRVTSKQYLTPYQTVLSNKEMKENVQNRDNVFYCDRGSDLIEGFTFFGDSGVTKDRIWFKNTNERVILLTHVIGTIRYWVVLGNYNFNTNYPKSGPTIDYQEYYIPDIGFSVNYIPMSDIKIKLDNNGDTRDSQLYNQNGKLTDSVALSKSLLSYSKEITSDNITKYGAYYTFSNVPSVGDIVLINSQKYVINNVSLDFFENEQNYYIRGEFTLSKAIAVKSLMVNPNQNIRDYGIPQNFNVKRKQLYRDFYELTFVRESSNYDWKLPLNEIVNTTKKYKPYQEHTAIMKLTYDEAINGNSSYYYQLDCTTYRMKKTIYEIVDFKDNNIIGYGSQNVWSGFDITRVISGMTDMVNTPISYVDNFGNVKDIELLFSNNLQLTTIYQQYIQSSGASSSNYSSFYSCFIPSNIYDIAINRGKGINYGETVYGYDFDIREIDYNKDATEVPVFEYSCQIDDSDDVIVGDNILDANENFDGYIYQYILAPKNLYDNNNFGLLEMPYAYKLLGFINYHNAVKIDFNSTTIKFTLYASGVYSLVSGADHDTYSNQVDMSSLDLDNNDIIIVKRAMNLNNNDTKKDLMFVIRNLQQRKSQIVSANYIELQVNHYKIN